MLSAKLYSDPNPDEDLPSVHDRSNEPMKLSSLSEPKSTSGRTVAMNDRSPNWEAQWAALIERALQGANGTPVNLTSLREQFEALIILRVWRELEYNITRTARTLGTSRARVRKVVKPWRTDGSRPAGPAQGVES